MHVIRFLPKQSARIFIDLAHRPLIEPRLVNERFSPSMASGVVSTTFSTSTSTGDPSMGMHSGVAYFLSFLIPLLAALETPKNESDLYYQ